MAYRKKNDNLKAKEIHHQYLNFKDQLYKEYFVNKNISDLRELTNDNLLVTVNFIRDELIVKCGLNERILYRLIKSLPKNRKLYLSKIIKNPYDYVTYIERFITYKKAKDIEEKYGLTFDINKKIISWMIDLIHESNKLYLEIWKVHERFMNEFELDLEILKKIVKEIYIDDKKYYTLEFYHELEKNMGDKLIELFINDEKEIININEHIVKYEEINNIKFTKKQIKAINSCVNNNLVLITGFPGTGKSTIIDCVCSYLQKDIKCIMAPTGMAVNNLRNKCRNIQIIGTIHKILYNDDIVKCDLIIIDECSMIDILMFYNILKLCEKFKCRLILLGDFNQLPPIGPGEPFYSIIKSEIIPVIELKDIKRQDEGVLKKIIKMMNKRKVQLEEFDSKSIEFIETNDYSQSFFTKLIDDNDLTEFNTKFIVPQHKGISGTESINKILEEIYNPIYCEDRNVISMTIPNKRKNLKLYDHVIRIVNDYKSVELHANGDCGHIYPYINDENQLMKDFYQIKFINIDKSPDIIYQDNLIDEYQLGYCTTIHKVQGSQYENIVLIMDDIHDYSWSISEDSKKLLYTAISRAKKRCIIIGKSKMFINSQTKRNIKSNTLFLKEFNENEILHPGSLE